MSAAAVLSLLLVVATVAAQDARPAEHAPWRDVVADAYDGRLDRGWRCADVRAAARRVPATGELNVTLRDRLALAVTTACTLGLGRSIPDRGIAIETRRGVRLLDARGRTIGLLRGYRMGSLGIPGRRAVRLVAPRGGAFDLGTGALVPAAARGFRLRGGHTVSFARGRWTLRRGARTVSRFATRTHLELDDRASVLTAIDAHGRSRAFDLASGRGRTVARGCRVGAVRAAAALELCGYPYGRGVSTIVEVARGSRRVLAPPARRRGGRPAGYWRSVVVDDAGGRTLAQWSGECEIPIAYVGRVGGDRFVPIAPDVATIVLGLLDRPLVVLPKGACGAAARRPGVYALGRSLAFLAPVARGERVEIWRT